MILMLAVTVLVATTVGGVIMDFNQSTDDAPFVTFESEQNESFMTFTHTGGNSIDGENLYIVSKSRGSLGNYAGTDGHACDVVISTLEPGQSCTVSGAPNEQLLLVWHSNGRSKVLTQATKLDLSTDSNDSEQPENGGTGDDGDDSDDDDDSFTNSEDLIALSDQTAGETTRMRIQFTIQPDSDTIGNSLGSVALDMDDSSLQLLKGTSWNDVGKAGVDTDGDGAIDLDLSSDQDGWDVTGGGSGVKIQFSGDTYAEPEADDTIIIVFDGVTNPAPGTYSGDIQTSGDGNHQSGTITTDGED